MKNTHATPRHHTLFEVFLLQIITFSPIFLAVYHIFSTFAAKFCLSPGRIGGGRAIPNNKRI